MSRKSKAESERPALTLPVGQKPHKQVEPPILKPASFNLIDEPWIPVLYVDGNYERVGIRQALADASRIREIVASNPMDRVAILRFLLSLLYWCKGNPPREGLSSANNPFFVDCFSKLDANRECFNLLGKGKRFYQINTARRSRSTTDLLQEIPTGNNFWHFRHSTDSKDGLCVACCAMGLLRLPLFSVSGLPDLKAGINGTPPIYVLPWGSSLQNTLLANWTTNANLGEPAWIQPKIRPLPDQDVPLLIGLTILSRQVWLHDPVEQPMTCISCGEKRSPVILTCEFQTAGNQENVLWNDPHVVYSEMVPRKPPAHDLSAAKTFRMDRPWPDLMSRMVQAGKFKSTKSTSLLIVGFATDKAKNIDVWERKITLPSSALSATVAADKILQWQKESRNLECRVSRSKAEGTATIAAIRPDVEAKVSAKIDELVTGTDATWEQAAAKYAPLMTVVAKSLSPGFTTAALQRRNQIASVRPTMSTELAPAKKPARKKKGDVSK